MPPCRTSPWCECGTRYDGGLIIYCDRHPPMEDGEAQFANEIYVNGNRWYLAKDIDPDAPRRTASQLEENDLAQRLSMSTQASFTEGEQDATSQVTQAPRIDYQDETTDVTETYTSLEYSVRDDLLDVDIDESLFTGDTDMEDNADLYEVSDNDIDSDNIDIDSDNSELPEGDSDTYFTPPNSPSEISQNSSFDILDASQEDAEKINRGLRPSVINGHKQHEIVPFNLLPAPPRLQSSITQGSGKYDFY